LRIPYPGVFLRVHESSQTLMICRHTFLSTLRKDTIKNMARELFGVHKTTKNIVGPKMKLVDKLDIVSSKNI
jgi:hypothetical protein